MDHRDQERDQNPSRYNQESPMKLLLAPLVSTPSERLRNAIVSTRLGISIFSPIQILDQLLYEENPATQDPDPTTTRAGAASSSRTPSKPPPPWESPQSLEPEASTTFNGAAWITYRECLKNHAASTGNHAVDGCREFMPSGVEGTQESVKCSACDCHRNVHRKEIRGESEPFHFLALPTTAAPPHHQLHFSATVAPMLPTTVNFSRNSCGGVSESSTEYPDMFQSSSGGHALMRVSSSVSKKRFRTEFNQKQKDMMHEFATKLGWRIQKEDDEGVLKFCNEVGVKRQVFNVWIHNNKTQN